MNWQSQKSSFIAIGATLLAIAILWLLASQVNHSYQAELKRQQRESENISLAVEQIFSAEIDRATLIQNLAADALLPLLSNTQTTANPAKIAEILKPYIAKSSSINAITITNSQNLIIGEVVNSGKNLNTATLMQLQNETPKQLLHIVNGEIYLLREIKTDTDHQFFITSRISISAILKKMDVFNQNEAFSISIFGNNLEILYSSKNNNFFSSNIQAIESFIRSNQRSSSFTTNNNKQSTLISLSKIKDSPLNLAVFNQNQSNLIAWRNNAILYVLGSILILGLILIIIFSLTRAKRLNRTLYLKESKLIASETRFRQMIEAMPIGLVLAKRQDYLIIYINKPAAVILDMPQASALSKRAFDLYDEQSEFNTLIGQVNENSVTHSADCILKRNNGQQFWARVSISMVEVADTQTLLIGFVDISEQKKLEAELKYQATIDYLSGLYNRAHFINLSNIEIQKIQRHQNNGCLLMLDIDHFKKVNDNYGHDAGDLVIQLIALTCQETLREIDIIGRLGGEEFAAFLPSTSIDQARIVAERVRKAIESKRIKLKDGQIINITSSIGLTEVTQQDHVIDIALKRADLALYSSKHHGRNRVTEYDSSLK